MMKKRSIWVIIAAVVAIGLLSFAFFIDKVTVSASSIALKEQGWKANFSVPLKESAIEDGDIYLLDQQDNDVDADLKILKNGLSVEVSNLKTGSYTLHVNRNAIKGGFFKSMSTSKLSFTVHKDLQSVKSEKELKEYFLKLQKMMAQNYAGGEMNATTESDSSSMDSSKSSASGTGREGNYSETNNQVEGVDEADLVKTDGEFIYSIVNGRVIITDIRKPSSMAKIAELPQDKSFYPMQLFLNKNTLIVLGEKYIPYDYSEKTGAADSKMMMPFNSATNVRLYDVKDTKNPKLVREIGAEGYLNGARLTDNILYFVTNVAPNYWMLADGGDVELRPFTFDSEKDDEALPMSFSDLSILPGTIEGTYSVITAMDLNDPKDSKVVTKGYLGSSNALYMSKESLYLTAPMYMPAPKNNNRISIDFWNPQATNTEIYKFTLDGTDVDFVSSGEVTGMLLNQFSMDEHDGYFRVVTTKGFAWDDKSPSENNLFILDAGMNQVGAIEGLAKGERIYSARFMGDKAYMVTFKETDPLFVMDVSNPSAPKVLGELKIPGFSNYLHPLDENHLIGFGYDTKSIPGKNGSQPRIITGGMKISLFDVTDYANPKEKDVEILGGQGTYSSIQYDHKALFQHRENGYYGFPVTLYEGSNKEGYGQYAGEGGIVYKITAEEGIKQVANMITKRNPSQPYEDWENIVQRMLYAGDTLYTISMKEIKSYDINTFKEIGVVTY